MEQTNLEKLELSVKQLQQELEQLNGDKLSLCKDISAMQQQLQGMRWQNCKNVTYFPFLRFFNCLIVLITEFIELIMGVSF